MYVACDCTDVPVTPTNVTVSLVDSLNNTLRVQWKVIILAKLSYLIHVFDCKSPILLLLAYAIKTHSWSARQQQQHQQSGAGTDHHSAS